MQTHAPQADLRGRHRQAIADRRWDAACASDDALDARLGRPSVAQISSRSDDALDARLEALDHLVSYEVASGSGHVSSSCSSPVKLAQASPDKLAHMTSPTRASSLSKGSPVRASAALSPPPPRWPPDKDTPFGAAPVGRPPSVGPVGSSSSSSSSCCSPPFGDSSGPTAVRALLDEISADLHARRAARGVSAGSRGFDRGSLLRAEAVSVAAPRPPSSALGVPPTAQQQQQHERVNVADPSQQHPRPDPSALLPLTLLDIYTSMAAEGEGEAADGAAAAGAAFIAAFFIGTKCGLRPAVCRARPLPLLCPVRLLWPIRATWGMATHLGTAPGTLD